MRCPKCGGEAECDLVDNGVGMQQCGPWGCPACHWVEPDARDMLVERAPSAESACCHEPLDSRGVCAGCGERPEVGLLLQRSNGWTRDSYLQLALAALDQAGVNAQRQRQIAEVLDVCVDCLRAPVDHGKRCDGCAEVHDREQDELRHSIAEDAAVDAHRDRERGL